MKIKCTVCGDAIDPLSSGLSLQKVENGKIVNVSSVHKGTCDQRIDPFKAMDSLPLDWLESYDRKGFDELALRVIAEMITDGEIKDIRLPVN